MRITPYTAPKFALDSLVSDGSTHFFIMRILEPTYTSEFTSQYKYLCRGANVFITSYWISESNLTLA